MKNLALMALIFLLLPGCKKKEGATAEQEPPVTNLPAVNFCTT